MVRPLKSAKAPTTWSWKSEEVPGVLEEQIAEEECRKSAALDKKREKKEKKKDKKHAKDKKKKKEKVVVPARVITLSALREELERYCTILRRSAQDIWARGPQTHICNGPPSLRPLRDA